MTRFAAPPPASKKRSRKSQQDKAASGQKKTPAATVTGEVLDDESLFAACKAPSEGVQASLPLAVGPAVNRNDVVADEKRHALPSGVEASAKASKGPKGGKREKVKTTKGNDTGKASMLSGTPPTTGREKLRPKASNTKPTKARLSESSEATVVAEPEEFGLRSNENRNNVESSSHPQASETKSRSSVMQIVEHDISELLMDGMCHVKGASKVTPLRVLLASGDNSGNITGRSDEQRNSNKVSSDTCRVTENSFSMKEEETPEKPLSMRYSVMPPLTVPRNGRKKQTEEKGTVSKYFSTSTSRASSAPSVSLSCEVSSTANSDGKASVRRSAHSSLEEALGGLLPNNFLYPTRQLLTRSLASAAEKERTATIVFDLDETLCNNRQHGPAILRPGAVEMLRHLRSLYPHPVLHAGEPLMESTGTKSSTQGVVSGKCGGAGSGCLSATETPPEDGVMLRLEIIIWTASVEVVARPVIARLDPDGTILDDVIYRDVRWYRDGGYTKDLRRIGRHLERNIIVENAPSCVCMNRRNAILVNDFVNNPADRQLVIVRAILQEWLDNVNTLLVHWKLRQTEQKRHRMVQDGGESPEPDQPLVTPLTQAGSAQSSASRSKAEVSLSTSTHGGEVVLQELEQKASAIHFLTNHPLISPGTRYVKPSAWKKAARYLNGSGAATAVTKSLTAAAAASPRGSAGGRSWQEQSPTTLTRPVVIAKPRGHRLFVDMARGPRESRQ
ncbi:uncharacterized protein Tco025E_05092 [Trypanosoma conorhini]|uniref:FCP1 homology domain-containing protein n=1 Tax=Trypanosoma conorhini TaxID=83891 RepID=A0A422PGA5_9TRYP|nr:uncharacterized protein Tco025E_05092 [Trypanosoma conorhini]RNF16713.1 hypothetical protein Tco025E_05092 [Trypanosoma conorhini]